MIYKCDDVMIKASQNLNDLKFGIQGHYTLLHTCSHKMIDADTLIISGYKHALP